jgi:hypothetical protein
MLQPKVCVITYPEIPMVLSVVTPVLPTAGPWHFVCPGDQQFVFFIDDHGTDLASCVGRS